MAERGASTIRSLGRTFKTQDGGANRKLDAQEFFTGLNECGCCLTKEETEQLLAGLDTDSDGTVNYDAFLTALRGSLNATRQAVVDAAFCKFDNGCGAVTASDLRVVYSCNAHPKVVSGEITEDEAFLEFLANFGDVNSDGMITCTEWNDYYAAVSNSIDNDDHFVELMKAAWKL